jgi:hypothetical protein
MTVVEKVLCVAVVAAVIYAFVLAVIDDVRALR